MADATMRQQLVEHLTPLLPKTWVIVPYSRNLDAPTRPTLMVHATSIRRASAAPQGAFETDYTLTVIDPQADASRAQGALDDEVLQLIFALENISYVMWESAEPVLFQDFFAWDIKTTVITRKDS